LVWLSGNAAQCADRQLVQQIDRAFDNRADPAVGGVSA